MPKNGVPLDLMVNLILAMETTPKLGVQNPAFDTSEHHINNDVKYMYIYMYIYICMYISIYPSFIVEPTLSDTPEYHIAAYTPNYPI